MSEHLSVDRVKQLVQTLFDAIARRVEGEIGLPQRLHDELAAEQSRFEAMMTERTQRYESDSAANKLEFDQVSTAAGQHFRTHYLTLKEEFDEALLAVNDQYNAAAGAAKQQFEETKWMLQSYFDESSGGTPKQQFEQFEHNVLATQQHLDNEAANLVTQVNAGRELLQRRRVWSDHDVPQPTAQNPSATLDELIERFNQLASELRAQVKDTSNQSLPMLCGGFMPAVIFVVTTALLTGFLYGVVDPAWLKLQSKPPMHVWLGMLGGVAAVLTALTQSILFAIARNQGEAAGEKLLQLSVDSDVVRAQWSKQAQRELKRRRKEFDDWFATLIRDRDAAIKKAEDKFNVVSAQATELRARGLREANERYPKLIEALTKERDKKLGLAEADYPERLKKLEARFQWDIDRIQKDHRRNCDIIQQRFDIDWNAMAKTWHESIDSLRVSADRLHSESAGISRRWMDLAFGNWTASNQIPPALRIGQFGFGLSNIEHGLPQDDRLMPETTEFTFPTLLNFPHEASLLLRSPGSVGRAAAVKLMQNVMLRLLTTIPPGKLRFTIIDPIGLGQDLSAFMHLADFDELLVSQRIWTEGGHIEQRLSDLTEHMETVFQTYLRNEFKTIEEYNNFAGEVAEPYHFLVIAGFPANFNEAAGRRLTSIITSGPRCGVYTLMSVDTEMAMPPNFSLNDIADQMINLSWHRDHFTFDDPDVAWIPFDVDELPEGEAYGRIVRNVGNASKDARRVEVSFERVIPKNLWENDSRGGIDVPLGRAGATKLQHMRLGRGTSQHVLVAGKTGSGKSTLMHILVTNLALHYSPDEIEFYLIDFKKGVEFKTYAANRLPHARVIAIESDREFGMSVLERLDVILKERGDLFRDCGVQDIASYRNANPDARMPRLLLLVDEFQEFFVEEDKLSQQAALLMDRLVRQGRAFGIHVLLGSQTLGGAYSLARSTLGQVAVRIALQCSEADAHLILSEDNTAARLLTRPGEAIYNDANGLIEGNHQFQIAWLEDERRDFYLEKIRDLTDERGIETEPPLVFEGNIPADVLNNRNFKSLLEAGAIGDVPRVISAWLGEAVAIKPHTAIGFRRLSGSHLLIVGQNAPGARGIMATVLMATALQVPPLMPIDAIFMDDDQPLDDDETVDNSSDEAVSATNTQPIESDPVAALKSFSFANFAVAKPTPQPTPEVKATPIEAAQYYILDGDLADVPESEFWNEATAEFPHHVRIGGPRDAASFINEIASVMRTRAGAELEPPIFLVIDNLGRFRDLKKADDEYSFNKSSGQTASPSKLFIDILKDGPSVGIHVLVWCDTYNNASRWMSNQTLRELEMRVAFQMSPSDSSNLIDSPAAGKLGANRALLFLEEQGSLEKFRPYGMPSDDLHELIHQRFNPTESAEDHEDVETCDDMSTFTVQ